MTRAEESEEKDLEIEKEKKDSLMKRAALKMQEVEDAILQNVEARLKEYYEQRKEKI